MIKDFKPMTGLRRRKTKSMERLEILAASIPTLDAFQKMAQEASDPEAFINLVEPLLSPNLPCCFGEIQDQHTETCPVLAKVKELEADVAEERKKALH